MIPSPPPPPVRCDLDILVETLGDDGQRRSRWLSFKAATVTASAQFVIIIHNDEAGRHETWFPFERILTIETSPPADAP